MLGEQATAMDKEALRKELGLDRPMLQQYTHFMTSLAQGDLGRSLHGQRPVSEVLFERIPATVELTIASMILAVLFGIPLGIAAAIRQYSWMDNSVLVGGLLGMSVPGFFLGPLLIWIFAILLPWFPVSERGGLEHLVLPAVSLALPLGAIIMRMTRSQMLEVIREDYIRTARAKGIPSWLVYFKHALANALSAIITIVGLQVGALLTGTVITETIFDWPGLGTLLYGGITQRDYPVVQGCVLLIALTYVGVNLLTDLAYGLVNPRVRYS
jgi:peptide/nickel transport system permease protein